METSALISRANNASTHTFSNSNPKYWKFDWYTPVKPKQAQSNEKSSGENDAEEKFSFKFKTWLPSEKAAWKQLEADVEETIDLEQYDRTKQPMALQPGSAPAVNGQVATNGLTADDIRGAVGGQETMIGFSASDTTAKSDAEPVEASHGATDGKASPTQSLDANSEPTLESEKKDADGDVDLK
ncbi:LAQU0S05e06810g1_1 [Lachancea quebecensis]|uniref:LAQU0S05e06810g1_1 n=1 Tax=Lachancea quebecensis TaxID=1654605 RepID=A0A0P1KQY0_9SACH|nr:LAQU0S05e06810g1_1 [Lachancea quebecensis]